MSEHLKVGVNILIDMSDKKYYSDRVLTKEEIINAPNSLLYYKAICENCGRVFETRLRNKGFMCKRCKCSLSQKEMYKNNPNLAKERLDKRTRYNIEHYGVKNPFQRDDVKVKIKNHMLEVYGVDNISKTNECKEKIKKTCLKKYGVEYSFQSENNKTKSKKTFIEKYGVDHPMKNQEIVDKVTKKNKLNREAAAEKAKQTCLAKYGVEHQMQNIDIQNSIKKKYIYMGTAFDSSWELAFWIFNIDKGNNIKRCNKSFEYFYNNKKHTYTPDFEINGKLYEIKGLQFFEIKDASRRMINPYDRSQDGLFEAKHQCALQNNVIFITDCKEYIDYVNNTYTKDFLNLFYKQLDFPYPNQDLKDKSYDGVIRHFHKSIYEASRKGQKCPLEAWEDKNLILKSALNRLKYVKRCSPEDVLRGFSVAKIAQRVSLFSSSLADKLIKKYLSEYDIIVDPFSGFSGRMIGAEMNGKTYIGKDINKKHVQESNEIIEYLKFRKSKVEVEDILNKKDITKADVLFTCPPYGGKEHWNKNNDEVEKSCDEWIDICLEKYKCKNYLFVVDETEKYKNYIVETLKKKSHFGNVTEYVILI